MSGAGPLQGVRILDFTTTFSGPYCTQTLSDLGADVLKVEAPGGDITRKLGAARGDLASVFAACNRDKTSIVLNLKENGDRILLRELIERADVLVHNMREAAATRLQIGPDESLEINHRLIHTVITGYGSNGPYAGKPAYDDCIQGASGLAALQSDYAGSPQYMATSIADKVAGMAAANAITSALYSRERTGVGQAIEVPMFETLAGFALMEQWGGRAFMPPVGEMGYARMRSRFRKPYRTTDGLISVVVYHQGHWERFLAAIGRSELLREPRFNTVSARTKNIDELYSLLEAVLATRRTTEWLDLFEEIDVPAIPVSSLDDLLEDPHLRAVGFFREVDSAEGKYLTARSATRYSHTPTTDPSDKPGPPTLDDSDPSKRVSAWAGSSIRHDAPVDR